MEEVWQLIGQHNSAIYSTLDLACGYWQLPLAAETKHKTSFVTPDRQFQWNFLPFGLCNAPVVFQKAMTEILRPVINKCALVYDIIIFSPSKSQHRKDLEKVFKCLERANMTLKPSKCKFAQNSVKYLGHLLSNKGILPNPAKTEIIRDFPAPTNLKQMRQFLGICNFYRQYIPKYGYLRAPLNDLLKPQNSFVCMVQEMLRELRVA